MSAKFGSRNHVRPQGPRRFYRRYRRPWKGIALYLVAVVVVILSLGAVALLALMQTEQKAASLRGDEMQTRAAAQSGVECVRAVTALTGRQRRQLGGIEHNPRYFAAVQVRPADSVPPGKRAFRFTVVSPNIDRDRVVGIRYGLTNESARLHLESVLKWEREAPGAGRRALMRLPRMTPTIADSLLDWIDPDKTPRASGAERDYYIRSGAPYGPRNAIPVSLEELLLVRDMQRNLLFGTDENFSYGYDPLHATAGVTQENVAQFDSREDSGASGFSDAKTVLPDETDFRTPDVSRADPSDMFSVTEEQTPGMFDGPGGMFVLPPEEEHAVPPLNPGGLHSDFPASFPETDETGGTDANGTVPPQMRMFSGTDDGTGSSAAFSSEPSRGLPWMYLLTTVSAEKEVDPQGVAKYDLNGSDLEYLHENISRTVDDRAASFVVLYRQNGPSPANADSAAPGSGAAQNTTQDSNDSSSAVPDLSRPAEHRLDTPLDLLEIRIEGATANPFSLKDPRGKNRFIKLLEHGTTSPDVVVTGRVNVNEAPKEVLEAIPAMNEQIATQILSTRRTLHASGRSDELEQPIWLVTENIVDLPTLKAMWNDITTGGDVYRCQVVGFLERRGTASRCEVVVDATVRPPRQVFFKDLTMYGRGFPESVLQP